MRLSICIPTFNRAEFLPELLDSIARQTGHDCELEVVVSDNASTDNTPAAIERYRDRLPLLTYVRQDTNRGPDRNFLKAVELATGDWCWLMGSDDVLETGAVARVEHAITAHPGIAGLSVERALYSITMDERLPAPGNDRHLFRSTRLVHDDKEIFPTTADYFGYLSGNIVDRRLWAEVVASEPVERFYNAYVHVFVMGRMLQRRPCWLYLHNPCVRYRTGNDFFLADGEFRRLEIDVVGYGEIVRALYGPDSAVTRRMDERVLYHVRHRVLRAKMNGLAGSFYRDTLRLSLHHYARYPDFWLKLAPVLAMPSRLARLGRAFYRQAIRPARMRRMTHRSSLGISARD